MNLSRLISSVHLDCALINCTGFDCKVQETEVHSHIDCFVSELSCNGLDLLNDLRRQEKLKLEKEENLLSLFCLQYILCCFLSLFHGY